VIFGGLSSAIGNVAGSFVVDAIKFLLD